MTTSTRNPWRIEQIDQSVVDRLAGKHTPDPLAIELGVDLVADPHREDDDGNVWTVLRSARSVADVTPGSAVVIGTHAGRWSSYCRSAPRRSVGRSTGTGLPRHKPHTSVDSDSALKSVRRMAPVDAFGSAENRRTGGGSTAAAASAPQPDDGGQRCLHHGVSILTRWLMA